MAKAKVINVVIAGKVVDKKWEAAVLSEGKFMRALTGDSLFKLVASQITALLSLERPEGTEVGINISINEAEEVKEEKKEDGANVPN